MGGWVQVVETPSPIYFDQALNCVRVLTRLLPFMLENPEDAVVYDLCWRRQPVEQPATQPEQQQEQDGDGAASSDEPKEVRGQEELGQPGGSMFDQADGRTAPCCR